MSSIGRLSTSLVRRGGEDPGSCAVFHRIVRDMFLVNPRVYSGSVSCMAEKAFLEIMVEEDKARLLLYIGYVLFAVSSIACL